MNEQIDYKLPERLLTLAESVPLPPIPRAVANRLEETKAFFFATDHRDPPMPGMLPEEASQVQGTAGIRWFAFGMQGHGLQSKHFDYFLLSDSLRLSLSIPYARIYGNRDTEREQLESAFALARLCLARPIKEERLDVILDQDRCNWRVALGDDVFAEGNEIMSLLGELSKDDGDVPARYWINV